jgi:hypothetical protein
VTVLVGVCFCWVCVFVLGFVGFCCVGSVFCGCFWFVFLVNVDFWVVNAC